LRLLYEKAPLIAPKMLSEDSTTTNKLFSLLPSQRLGSFIWKFLTSDYTRGRASQNSFPGRI